MSHRLQVLISEDLDTRIANAAQRSRTSKGAWVRRAIEAVLERRGGQERGGADPLLRLAVARGAYRRYQRHDGRDWLRAFVVRYSPSSLLTRSTARNASCGISTRPTRFMRFLPSFCFSSSLRLREMSPP